MRRLIFLALIILAGFVAYTYYFGKGEDKERAENIVRETKDLTRSVGEFIKKQKDRYDDGEFDRLFDRIGNTIKNLRNKKTENQEEVNQDLKELETENGRLKKLLAEQVLENEVIKDALRKKW